MRAPRSRVSLAAAFLAWTSALAALPAPAATNLSPWLRVVWSSADGLPNNTVVGLAQTRDGFLWLGTPVGLARFDGLSFEEFSSTNFIPLPNRGIVALAPSSDGGLHLGMDRGAVVSLHNGRKDVFLPDTKLSLLTIDTLTEDAEGGLWVAYRDGTVGRIENGRMLRFVKEQGFPAGPMMCSLACDSKGRLWFTKSGNLGVWRDGKFVTLKTLPEQGQARLSVARNGGLWICAGSHLYRCSEACELEDHSAFTPRHPGSEPTVVLEGRDGAVWIGTTFSGLYRYQDGGFESVPTTHQEILAMMQDAEGNIWAGTGGGGLIQVRSRAATLENADGGLTFEGVQSLCQDAQGTVWAVLQNGALARQRNGRWQTLPTSDSWSGDAVSVCADPSGAVWVGTRFHRLLCWRDERFVPWGDAAQIKGQTVHTLVVATNGDIWLGEDTPVAVQRLRHGKLDTFDLPPDLRVIRASVQDAAGAIWFGTSKGVLLRATDGGVVDETPRTTGEPQSIRGLCATADGSVWIAYAGWGVGRFKNGKFAAISAHQGLYDDYVSQIISDQRGWLWFGANRGLFKVRQKELDALADGQLSRVRSVHFSAGEFGQGEGRPSLQANFGSAPMAMRSRDGRLWLPMRTGLVVVDPAKLRENRRPPAVLLSRIKLGDTVVATYGGLLSLPHLATAKTLDLAKPAGILRVPPDHRRMEFEFTGLNFAGAENNTYRYRLDGVDEDWVETSHRNAVYNRLVPGKYQFQVLACNSEGVWNETGAKLQFVVAPFFWQTWWFRGASLATFTGLVIALVRYVSFRRLRLQLQHLEQQAALHRERARIAKDIHDDLGASLTQISCLASWPARTAPCPTKSPSASRTSSHRPAGDQVAGRNRLGRQSPQRHAGAFDRLHRPIRPGLPAGGRHPLPPGLARAVPARELSTDVRHNLFLVVKEALNNIVKHARARELRLQIMCPTNDSQFASRTTAGVCPRPKTRRRTACATCASA